MTVRDRGARRGMPSVIDARVLVKLCCGLSLLLILAFWFDVSSVVRQLLAIDPLSLAAAIGLLVLQFTLCCVRWIYILDRQDHKIASRHALAVFGAGTLANLFLVTSVAGMSVRAALLARSGAGMAVALASVTAERMAAAAGLGACAALGLVFGLPTLRSHFGAWSGGNSDVVLTVMMAAVALAFVPLLWTSATLRRFVKLLWHAFSPLKSALLLILVSGATVLIGFAGLATLARGMGLEIDPLFFISVMPAIAFIASLPISVGGWGVREGAMVAGLAPFSVAPESAMALSISYGLASLLVALTMGGLLVLLGDRFATGES